MERDADCDSVESLVSTDPHLRRIKDKTNCVLRSLWRYFPTIIWSDNGKTEVYRKVSQITNEDWDWELNLPREFTPCPKIKIEGSGDWGLIVKAMHRSHFEKRSHFDEVCSPAKFRRDLYLNPNDVKARIPIREAFSAVGVKISIDVDYLARNGSPEIRSRIAERLGMHYIGDLVNRKAEMESLERIFFYKAMEELFGGVEGQEADEVIEDSAFYWRKKPVLEYMIADFKLLSADGNEREATFRRGTISSSLVSKLHKNES